MSIGMDTKQHLPRTATEIDRRIGQRIRARRIELQLSQEKLAEMIGVTFQQVQKYERGVNRVAASTLFRILNALELKPAEMFESIGESKMDDFHMDEPEAIALLKAFSALKTAEKKKAALAAIKAISKG